MRQEILPIVTYKPDIERIKRNGVCVYMAAGKQSLDKRRFYAETAPIMAGMLGCELVIFPGHHISYLDKVDEWTAVLRNTLHNAIEMEKSTR